MKILRLSCPTPEHFLQHYQEDAPGGAIFCPTTTDLAAGTPVVVELRGKWLPNNVLFRGTVLRWRRAIQRLRIRAGAFVQFDADEIGVRDFILGILGGRQAVRRRHGRVPLRVPVRICFPPEVAFVPAELRNISLDGALVRVDRRPPVGSRVVLELIAPGGAGPQCLDARVTYHAKPDRIGIAFTLKESGGGKRRVRELVRRFRAA